MSAPTRLLLLQRPSEPLEPVCARLRGWGCAMHPCAGPDELFAMLAAVETDLVLIDAGVQDSMAIVGAIKADARLRSVPVIAAAADDAGVVAAHALALGADDVFPLPIEDAELYARTRALARLATMEAERRWRDYVLAEFGVVASHEAPAVPAIDRLGILLIGPAGPEQILVSTALGGAATLAYAENPERALDRLCRQELDVAVVTGGRNHDEVRRLCAAIRGQPDLFDLPVVLIDRAERYPERALPFEWGVSDVLFQPFHPEILRLRIHGWVRQQRLRRRLRGVLHGAEPPAVVDRLTRVYSHGFLHGYLEHRVAEALHAGATLAVASFAVTGLGQINARYGFAAGDRVLAQVGAVLGRASRAEDLPGRIGDDRFCLVLSGGALEDAQQVGARVAETLARAPVPLGGDARAPGIPVRAGAAQCAEGDDAARLIARALAASEPEPVLRAS